MVNLRKFLKPYKDAGALHALFPISRFIDHQVFLTKRNQVGVVLELAGIDDECLAERTGGDYTRQIAADWRCFDERFRMYQYVIKQDHAPIQQRETHSDPAVSE